MIGSTRLSILEKAVYAVTDSSIAVTSEVIYFTLIGRRFDRKRLFHYSL